MAATSSFTSSFTLESKTHITSKPSSPFSLRHLSLSSKPFSHPSPSLSARSSPFSLAPLASSNNESNPFVHDNFDKPREECGVVGVIGDPDASSLCYLGLQKLQHRGEEGAGIVAADSDSGKLTSVTGLGLVTDVFASPESLKALPGTMAIGHVRYSTSGATSSLMNVQPFLASYRFGQLAVCHNGNLLNHDKLKMELESKGSIFNTSSDTEVILHLIAASTSRPLLSRIIEVCECLEGAYSLLFLTSRKLFAVRDPFGFRPLVLGRRPNGSLVFASETCALDLVDAEYVREINPGEVVVADLADMSVSSACLMPRMPRKACIFEHIYFALPNSIVFGKAVHESRSKFGRALAEESPVPNADVVIPVPDSGFYAALGFSQASGIPFQQGLLRSHYVGRTFIQPSQEIRDLSVRLKLSPVRGVLEGKSVVVVDDSIVRGTTSSKIVSLLRHAGAREVHFRIASPPVVGSCYYGVDTPSEDELISNRMDTEGVCKEIGSDSLAFLSLSKLRELLATESESFCDACFSKEYPVPPRKYDLAVGMLE
ncbi:hypothetical protein LUZ60_001679 [Juncus effusus]|nr:hypothetical protein LUZ60_001679 [Juncus effusus]